MTNNPTIDGELRELLERLMSETTNWPSSAWLELRALLDAPVVEREPVAPFYISADDWNLLVRGDIDTAPVRISRTRRGKFTESLFAHPPEIAALQSTIAQLQARVQELESAMGEPVIDLDAADWAAIQEAAAASNWIPPEYFRNDWVSDVCRFLRGNEPDKYDEVLQPFLTMMRNELHTNSGKGDRPGWLSMTPGECLLEIYYHLGKLQKGVKDGNKLWITEYSADVANMAMMLADICGCLNATAALNEVRK